MGQKWFLSNTVINIHAVIASKYIIGLQIHAWCIVHNIYPVKRLHDTNENKKKTTFGWTHNQNLKY